MHNGRGIPAGLLKSFESSYDTVQQTGADCRNNKPPAALNPSISKSCIVDII